MKTLVAYIKVLSAVVIYIITGKYVIRNLIL
jgi:hypothetical protein